MHLVFRGTRTFRGNNRVDVEGLLRVAKGLLGVDAAILGERVEVDVRGIGVRIERRHGWIHVDAIGLTGPRRAHGRSWLQHGAHALDIEVSYWFGMPTCDASVRDQAYMGSDGCWTATRQCYGQAIGMKAWM